MQVCLLFIISLCSLIIWLLLGPWTSRAKAHHEKVRDTGVQVAELKEQLLLNHQEEDKTVRGLQAKMTTQGKELKMRFKQVDSANDIADQTRQQNQLLQAQVTRLQKVQDRQASEHQQTVASLQRDLARQQQQIGQTQTARQQAKNQQGNALVTEQARARTLEQQLARSRNAVQKNQQDKVQQQKDEVGRARQMAALRKELNTEQSRTRQQAQQLRQLNGINENLRKEVSRLTNRTVSGPRTRQHAHDMATLRAQLNEAKQEKENLRAQIADLTRRRTQQEDTATERKESALLPPPAIPAPSAASIRNQVTRYYAQYGFSETDWTTSQGARRGGTVWVWRNGQAVSKMEVLRIRNDRALLRFPPGAPRIPLKIGDEVRPGN
jgi:exonuclease SbcC